MYKNTNQFDIIDTEWQLITYPIKRHTLRGSLTLVEYSFISLGPFYK